MLEKMSFFSFHYVKLWAHNMYNVCVSNVATEAKMATHTTTMFQPFFFSTVLIVDVMCVHIIRLKAHKFSEFAKKYCANNDVKSHSLKTILHILTIILARARARTLHSNREGHQYGRIAEHTQCTRTIVPTWRWQSGLLDESSCIGGKSTKAMMGINERKRSIKTEVVARVQKKEQTWSKSRQYRLSMRARHQQRGTSRSTGSACRTSSSIENPAAAV